jgi:hypothetical protein
VSRNFYAGVRYSHKRISQQTKFERNRIKAGIENRRNQIRFDSLDSGARTFANGLDNRFVGEIE